MTTMIARPDSITQAHWDEWTIESCVHPGIVALNVRSVRDVEIDAGGDISTPIHDALNWTFSRFGHQTRPELRGWLVSGSEGWVRFKPDPETPIVGADGKKAKYLSPKGAPSRLILLRVPRHVWQRVCDRHGLTMPTDPTIEFWDWVRANKVPVLLIEGEKKAGALLTLGYVAIALPGITGGVRTKNAQGVSCTPHLIPDLAPFATQGREVTISFDYETRTKQLRALEKEIEKLKTQFSKLGCSVKIVELPGPDKGVDDLIRNHGSGFWDQVYAGSKTFEQWQVRRFTRLSYPASVTLNRRYLGVVEIPSSEKLICYKSAKGTGKTEGFIKLVEEAHSQGQRVIVLTHRTQLGQAICDRIGLPYVTELRGSEEGASLGYGLCIDSLHPESQARFNADDWHGCLLIVDEAEQVFWHLLDATTEVANRRMPILGQLSQLLKNTLESDRGRVILSDADLSDLSIEFVWGLCEQKIEPYIVLNEYQPEDPWLVSHYEGRSPDACFAALNAELESGGRAFVFTQSQRTKGRWAAINIEGWARRKYPNLRILRIDSQTIADPSHEAYLCASNLNQLLVNYDLVIATSSIETGVSIDLRGHFTSVFGFLNGVTPENSARQALARVREAVPRHVWVAKYGLGKVANGSASVRAILSAEYEIGRVAQKITQVVSFEDEMIQTWGSALRTWAMMAARINAGAINYRQSVIAGLEAEGHIVVPAGAPLPTNLLVAELEEVRDEQRDAEYEAIASAEEITPKEFDALKSKKAKTREDWQQQKRYAIAQRYGVDVTPDLVKKDDDGWYPQIRLYYYLMAGSQFLQDRDKTALEAVTKTAGAWLPTLNRSQVSTRVQVMRALSIERLLNLDNELNGGSKALDYENAHPELLRLRDLAVRHSWQIKNFLGVTVSERMSPIQIAQTLLGKLGLKLTGIGQRGGKGARERMYIYETPKDGRLEVLEAWFTRDQAAALTRSQSEMHTPGIKDLNTGRAAA